MEAIGAGHDQILRFRTNLDEWVTAGSAHPIRFAGDSRFYIEIRHGLEALVGRSVYYDLIELAMVENGLWSNGVFFNLAHF